MVGLGLEPPGQCKMDGWGPCPGKKAGRSADRAANLTKADGMELETWKRKSSTPVPGAATLGVLEEVRG